MKTRLTLFALSVLVVLHPSASLAQWQPDGITLSTTYSAKTNPKIVSDGSGGAIVAWQDDRNGNPDVYAQRVNASGVAQWTAGGVALCTAAGNQVLVTLVSDGAGGAIVTWEDHRAGTNVYAQRIDASGLVQWTTNGVLLCTAGGARYAPVIAPDGAGGAIVTWDDYRSGTNYDIYAQRVNASGVVQWSTDGVALCAAANDQLTPTIASDGAGGAIATWEDARSGVEYDIYAQRIDASGSVQWMVDGVALCTATGFQYEPTIAPDGSGGATVTWRDNRSGTDYDIYAQQVNASGVPQWATDGVVLCSATNTQRSPVVVSDGAGGAIVAWRDVRNGVDYDIYSQWVNASGVVQWTPNGVAMCAAAGDQASPGIASDGAGGAIVTWQDDRNGNYDIYSQRVNTTGIVQWTGDGVALCSAVNDQFSPTIVSDGAGGVIVTWYDNRSGSKSDIYAQHVEGRYGYWGHPEPTLYSVADVPADQGGKVKLDWYASGRDVLNQSTISHYSIWRATDAAAAQAAMKAGASLVGLGDIGPDFSGPAIREQKTATSDYFWELIGTQDAIYRTAYSFTASTNFDSTAAGPATNEFQIVAHAYGSQYLNWPSNVMSGHSVDNLAPAAPLYLIAQRNGSEVDLTWNGVHVSDLKDYTIYRSDASGVTPIQTDFLANDADTVLVDSGAPLTSLYYIVTAYDVHGNQSKPSNEASVSAATNAGRTPSLTALTVLQNRPNPFEAQTELEIGLPAASEIHLEVYDVAGHRVREEDVAGVRGWQAIRFSGRDDRGEPLASGMYFYKVAAHGETVTRKMVIAR